MAASKTGQRAKPAPAAKPEDQELSFITGRIGRRFVHSLEARCPCCGADIMLFETKRRRGL